MQKKELIEKIQIALESASKTIKECSYTDLGMRYSYSYGALTSAVVRIAEVCEIPLHEDTFFVSTLPDKTNTPAPAS